MENLQMGISVMTTLLGNDGKMMLNPKFSSCLFRSSSHGVRDSWIQFQLICFQRLYFFASLDKYNLLKLGTGQFYWTMTEK